MSSRVNANKNRAFYYKITTDVELGDTIQVGGYSYIVANKSVRSGEDYKDMYLIMETDETAQRKIEHADMESNDAE